MQRSNPSDSEKPDQRRLNRRNGKDRLIFILRLFLPIVIFIVGFLIINTKTLLPDKPSWQKNTVGGLFIIYSAFRLYQAIKQYFSKNGE
jgi:hypothetical protein